jgi:hypothetical protein
VGTFYAWFTLCKFRTNSKNWSNDPRGACTVAIVAGQSWVLNQRKFITDAALSSPANWGSGYPRWGGGDGARRVSLISNPIRQLNWCNGDGDKVVRVRTLPTNQNNSTYSLQASVPRLFQLRIYIKISDTVFARSSQASNTPIVSKILLICKEFTLECRVSLVVALTPLLLL